MIPLLKKIKTETAPTLIYHHLGLGDHLILSGGLKYLKKKSAYNKAYCICKHVYLASVKQLYADVDDFEIISINDWQDANNLVDQWNGPKLKIGFEKMVDWYYFDKDFYRIMNVDFVERWKSFSIKRNMTAENKVLHDVHTSGNFVFIHDDASRGFKIDDSYVSKDLSIVRPFLTNSIFDWISVLEWATEIHCICSSFKHLIDSLPNINAKLFYHHSYVNNGSPREASISASDKTWTLV